MVRWHRHGRGWRGVRGGHGLSGWHGVSGWHGLGGWRAAGAAGVVVACLLSTACAATPERIRTVGATGGQPSATPSPTPSPTTASEPVALTLSPASGATNVSPADAISAGMTGGSLETVSLNDAQGNAVTGDFAPDRRSWRNSQPLAYNKSYRLTATATGRDGSRPQQGLTFTTVKPKNYTLPYLRANDGALLDKGTFGVGQPVVVSFDEKIPDKAAAERTLTVTTDPPGLVGGWYWMNDHEVHWRPKEYWPAHTKVTVAANAFGKDFGAGLYGQQDVSATFTVGSSKIAIADSQTHRMKVFVDGQQVTTINGNDVTDGIPISMGKGGTERTARGVVDFTTNSGPHVITLKYEVYRMTSASFGITDPSSRNYYDERIRKSMRISGDGEFVHLRDWDVHLIGVANTSHGCVNVGVPYIYWFYDNFGAGDIVDVKGTSRQLDVHNGLGDWVLSWEEWLKGSALS